MTTIAVFNHKGRVGATSLAYHLAWMYDEFDVRVLVADLDPQANLTGMFLDEARLEALWGEDDQRSTVYGALRPLLEGTGDIADPEVEEGSIGPGLLVGDLRLARAEEELSNQWARCLDGDARAFRVSSAVFRILRRAAAGMEAKVVLLDVGPNLGALTRAALIAADQVVVPVGPDLYSFEGLRSLGPTLRRWRAEWRERRERNPDADLELPEGNMYPVGYVFLRRLVRLDLPVDAFVRWKKRIPAEYRNAVLGADPAGRDDREFRRLAEDPHCLAALTHYHSLMPLAEEARRPMFALRPGDGVFGSQAKAVAGCRREFAALARRIARECSIEMG